MTDKKQAERYTTHEAPTIMVNSKKAEVEMYIHGPGMEVNLMMHHSEALALCEALKFVMNWDQSATVENDYAGDQPALALTIHPMPGEEE